MALLATSLVAETKEEKAYRKGVVGAYGRMDGMVYYSLKLQRDGVYVFTQSDCFTSSPEKGKWVIEGDVVVLDRKEKVFRRFQILPAGKPTDLALLPLDDVSIRDGEKDEQRLFLPRDEKKE
jgi:hypothetical protein